ncbi:hypothetical protein C5167_048497, partial [Papaver somniferum]
MEVLFTFSLLRTVRKKEKSSRKKRCFEVNRSVVGYLLGCILESTFRPGSNDFNKEQIAEVLGGNTWSGNSLCINDVPEHLKFFGKLVVPNLAPSKMHLRQMIRIWSSAKSMGFLCLITRICSVFEIGANDSQRLVSRPHNRSIINRMRGRSHAGTNTSVASNTPMQDFDLETFYRRLSRRNDYLERQVIFSSNKFPDLAADLTNIAQDYKDTKYEEDF